MSSVYLICSTLLVLTIILFRIKRKKEENMRSSSLTTSSKQIKRWVMALSCWYLFWQLIGFIATVIFYLIASPCCNIIRIKDRQNLRETIHKTFYPRNQWEWLRRENILEVRIFKPCRRSLE